MIERVDQALLSWAGQVLPSVELRLSAPAESADPPCVHLYLMGIRPAPPSQQVRRAPLAVTLQYLVTVAASDPAEAHRCFGELLFAAMSHERFEVDLEALTPEMWRAFGVAPRPGFVLRTPLQLERPQQLQRVTGYPQVRPVPAVPFVGILLGPGDLPLAGACVTLAELGINTTTDNDGRFRFPAVLPGAAAKRLRIQAKGLDIETAALPTADPLHQPVIIRFTALEV